MENEEYIKKLLKKIEDKLCINEINKLLVKESSSFKENVYNINELLELNTLELIDVYKKYYGFNSTFLFKDFKKLYYLIQNYKYNMFFNRDISCFFDETNINSFIKEEILGITSIFTNLSCEIPESLLLKHNELKVI